MFSIQKTRIILGLAAALLAGHAGAADKGWVDSVSVDFGSGPEVRMLRLGVQKNWDAQWFASGGRHLAGYWDLSASWWRGNAYRGVPGQHQNLAVVGITPVLRYESDDKLGWYAEGGIGANLFSELYDNNNRKLSTAFEFGDHIGIGYVTANKWDLALKLQHFSNGGIKEPNNGANFLVASVRYHF